MRGRRTLQQHKRAVECQTFHEICNELQFLFQNQLHQKVTNFQHYMTNSHEILKAYTFNIIGSCFLHKNGTWKSKFHNQYELVIGFSQA